MVSNGAYSFKMGWKSKDVLELPHRKQKSSKVAKYEISISDINLAFVHLKSKTAAIRGWVHWAG